MVAGDHRGASLGFATANLSDIPQLVPADGVYAGLAHTGGSDTPAAISIGTNPTFGGSVRKVEAHLLDFQGTLSDQRLSLQFGDRLRDQIAFESPDALAARIQKDIADVRQWADQHASTRKTSP